MVILGRSAPVPTALDLPLHGECRMVTLAARAKPPDRRIPPPGGGRPAQLIQLKPALPFSALFAASTAPT